MVISFDQKGRSMKNDTVRRAVNATFYNAVNVKGHW